MKEAKTWQMLLLFLFLSVGVCSGELWQRSIIDSRGVGGEFSGGSGTEIDPYMVATVADLIAVGEQPSAHYLQISAIDLDGVEWSSIGRNSAPFTGSYNGAGFKILNLNGSSLFGVAGTADLPAHITSLVIEDANVSGAGNTGIVANILYGVVSSSTVSGNVSGSTSRDSEATGGVVGLAQEGSELRDLHFTGVVGGEYANGGLVGSLSGRIVNSSADATVTASMAFAGGLVGSLRATGEIYHSFSSGDVGGNSSIGGLLGSLLGAGQIGYSWSTSRVDATGNRVGGLVGVVNGYSDTARVVSSYASGSVKGGSDVGGLIGSLRDGVVEQCYSVGTVTGSSFVGGLIGGFSSATNSVSGSFWDTGASGRIASNAGGVGKTTAEMRAQATYTGWDFSRIWGWAEAYDYPVLVATEETSIAGDPTPINRRDGRMINYLAGEGQLILPPLSTLFQVEIYTARGQVVYRSDVSVGSSVTNYNLQTSNISKGIYLLYVKGGGQEFKQQILIQ